MATTKKFLQAAAGVGGGEAGPLAIEDVFSTYLYTGNGTSQTITNGIQIGDGPAEGTVLQLTCDDLNDHSPIVKTTTNVGATVDTTTKKYGTGSLYFDGADFFRSTDASFALGTNDFTIEFWVYLPDANALQGIFRIWDGSNQANYSTDLYISNGLFTWDVKSGATGKAVTANTSIASNTWAHVALTRYQNELAMYVNGVKQTDTEDATGFDLVYTNFELGTHYGTLGETTYCFTGYIDDLRLTAGSARYTASFTPPSAALPLDTVEAGQGGLVWTKPRSAATFSDHILVDSERGDFQIQTNTTAANNAIASFNFSSTGYVVPNNSRVNKSSQTYASWTFRKAPRFFDVVTYTGNGTAGRTISHNLGTTVGAIIIKRTDASSNWVVYHRGNTAAPETDYLTLNTTDATSDLSSIWFDTAPTDTEFTLGDQIWVNASGGTYVAYLFAHDPLGPSGDGSDGLIACGSYTGNGGTSNLVNLGWEPQWILVKKTNEAENWRLLDNMRGITSGGVDPLLQPNVSNAELSIAGFASLSPKGFDVGGGSINDTSDTYVYIAIRRGPMRVPTSGTEVFTTDANLLNAAAGGKMLESTFPVDWHFRKQRTGGPNSWFSTNRLTPNKNLTFDSTGAEATTTYANRYDLMDGVGTDSAFDYTAWAGWAFKRAPNFFDVVAYTGDGVAGRTVPHNLGVAPEMMIVKKRNAIRSWTIYHSALGASAAIFFDDNAPATGVSYPWNNTAPTDTNFTTSNNDLTNGSGDTYIAYLFATLAGVSKVGTYTGNGTENRAIDCGFTAGARFVILRRLASSSDWFVFDTARGITTSADPFLKLNTTAAEDTGQDWIEPNSSGFAVNSIVNGSPFNVIGTDYIFLAIA